LAWNDIPGWPADDHAAAFATFLASCRTIVRGLPPAQASKPVANALVPLCEAALKAKVKTDRQARAFFEARFQPAEISRIGETEGFLTGYYEPIVSGSRVRTAEYTVPMYRRPPDLIAEAPPAEGGAPANKGRAWRLEGGTRVPYHDRAAIDGGALAGKGLEICWLKDPIDAFFIHIQGSSRVRLEDGTVLRLNYDGHNGHAYTPVGRILVQREAVPKEEMSMDRIRQWMQANPNQAAALRNENKSYIFFRVASLADHEEAIGAQGIPLTADRSIAVDRNLHAYGTPFWIDAALPLTGVNASDHFQRLMIAQDTGGAIIGPARADIYFGAGEKAGQVSGRIRHPGRFVMLIPNALHPARARVPWPRAKP
jgi:membrane-bound lytic murein transglycosylase A